MFPGFFSLSLIIFFNSFVYGMYLPLNSSSLFLTLYINGAHYACFVVFLNLYFFALLEKAYDVELDSNLGELLPRGS